MEPPPAAIALRALDDPALVRRMADRQPEAIGELHDRYAGMLLALASRVLGNPSDAEEVVQEALLQAWNQAPGYDPSRSSVSTWLVLITRSRAIDRLRTRRVGERTAVAARAENPVTHTSPTGLQDVWFRERRERVRRELAELPPEQQQVLELAFYEGLTQTEIAARTGIPLGTVKTRTLLAMKKLRKALRDDVRELL